jgi:hypothetical protein
LVVGRSKNTTNNEHKTDYKDPNANIKNAIEKPALKIAKALTIGLIGVIKVSVIKFTCLTTTREKIIYKKSKIKMAIFINSRIVIVPSID